MSKSSSGQVKWTHLASKALEKDAGPKYSRLSESLRHLAPGAMQCSMFCGGKQCKYENPSKIGEEKMAIKGLYSTWITENIMAMARPSTEIMKEYGIIEQFRKAGIRSVMNLQRPEEHASCGYGLEDSGFSYKPEDFMQDNIFFYNFGWNDYGVRSLESILDMVKVMSFALQEGKAAVHCHAGLGRTGVLICCFFIFSERLKADEAIHKMRLKRPKAVQTRGQIECVNDFAKFISHLWVIFASGHHEEKAFTLEQYLIRQKRLLHGFESRRLKHIPKIVYNCCMRLLELANVKSEDSPDPWSLSDDIKSMFVETSPNVSTAEQPRDTPVQIAGDDSSTVLARSCSAEGISDSKEHSCTRRKSASDFEEERPLLKTLSDVKLRDSSFLSALENGPGNVCARPSSTKAVSSAAQSDRSTCGQNTDERIRLAKALAASACADTGVQNRVERLKRKLNSSNAGWEELKTESDPWVLTRLLWSWLDHLSEPVMSQEDVDIISDSELDPISAFNNLQSHGTRKTLQCLLATIHQLGPLPDQLCDRVLRRVAMALTHSRVLSLTLDRASLDAMGQTDPPSPTENRLHAPPPQSQENDYDASQSESIANSASYRLRLFLRRLMTALQSTP